jgi:hypothetical protein
LVRLVLKIPQADVIDMAVNPPVRRRRRDVLRLKSECGFCETLKAGEP